MRRRLLIPVVCLAASACGCVVTKTPDRPRYVTSTDAGGPQAVPDAPVLPDRPTPANVLDDTTSCEGRLHAIEGLLLQYYMLNRRYPDRLEEALALDPAVPGACPNSGRPYAYVPPTGASFGRTAQLAVYAPTANKNGTRWVILLVPRVGQHPPAAWVKTLSDIELQGYLRSGIPTPPPPALPVAAPAARG